MFAEELSGNASKKRQDEAKARRRQIKQQQAKQKPMSKAPQIPSSSPCVPNNSGSGSSSGLLETTITTTAVSLKNEIPESESLVTSAKRTAVQNALQQRQLRQQSQLESKSLIRIQAAYRSYKAKCDLLKNQNQLLTSRLGDLILLRDLVKRKTKMEYIPPPATVSMLVLQILVLNKSFGRPNETKFIKIRSHDDVVRIQQVIEYVVMPGILSQDDNLDPILPWPPTRFRELIRLALMVLVHPIATEKSRSVVNNFLRAITAVDKKKEEETRFRSYVLQAQKYLLPVVSSPSSVATVNDVHGEKERKVNLKVKRSYPHEQIGSTLDLICILRHHLLFSRGNPIPQDASRLREACFTDLEKKQSDTLFLLTLDCIMATQHKQSGYHSRFLLEVLTVPLLTWKTSIKATLKLLSGSSKPMLLDMLESIGSCHAAPLSEGKLDSILSRNDVSLTDCPATPSQILLANLVTVGRVCPAINGSKGTNYSFASLFYDFLATLVNTIPLATFSTSRESVVEWISDGKSHLTAIVLSPIILEQCKYLLHDSFVRDLFLCAIGEEAMNSEAVLQEKNDIDRQQEKELLGNINATALAAKEARIDRTKNFWNSSSWAKKLKNTVSKIFVGGDIDSQSTPSTQRDTNGLINTSSVSRKLASKVEHSASSEFEDVASSKKNPFDPKMYFSLCRVYAIILARWGGGGRDDIVGRSVGEEKVKSKESRDMYQVATQNPDPCTLLLLHVLCFSTPLIRTSWAQIQSNVTIVKGIYKLIDPSKGSTPVRSLHARVDWKNQCLEDHSSIQLFLFLCTLTHSLIITDDVELYDMDKPLPLHQIRRCIQVLKSLLLRACCKDIANSPEHVSNYFGLALISASSKTMRDLYDRSSRRPLCLPKLWIVEDLLGKEISRCKTHENYVNLLSTPILRICPYLVSFKRRLKLFERIITTNRIDIQGQHNSNPFSMDSGFKPGIPVRIMRGRVLEDGLSTMNKLGKDMRKRIVVHYLNEAGAQEAGVDVGGLFKEFWTDISAIAFDPNYALFRVTEGAGGCMYPNPGSWAAHGSDHIILFEFLGRILGKALYEGITIRPQFAHFFLSFLRGDYNFLHMLPDLSTMDAQLYNNLMFLKNYGGDAEDLCLTFTIANDDFGSNNQIQLIPDGENIFVTNDNKQRYIGMVAKYRLYDRLKDQSQAFTRGLWDVIERPWLQLFNEPELQILISGPCDGAIDIDDMRANTRYVGGFTSIDRTVNRFWSVMASFTSEQRASLLRFVTSCERPPPLGFASMNPPFTLQRVGILRDGDKLPTASTCFNTLKLPTYSSEKIMKQRLLYSMESGAGFELS